MAFGVSTVLFGTLLIPVAQAEVVPGAGRPEVPSAGEPVAGRDGVALRKSPLAEPYIPGKEVEPTLPAGGSADVTVGVASARVADGADLTQVGGLPVAVTRTAGAAVPTVRATIKPQKASGGGDMVLVLESDQTEATVTDVQIDYSAFSSRFGGGYGSRLTLVGLPACAATTPSKPACAVPVTGRHTVANDAAHGRLVAQGVQLKSGEPTVLAMTADVSGDKGTFGASPLSPSGTWSTDLQSGSFAWSYPIQAPDVPGGFAPTLGLSYSSGGIDGRTGGTNNQASLVGDGFDLWPGYIERKYKSCALDEVVNDAGGRIGDQCWDYDNAVISFNGGAGELVPAGTDVWRLQKDDGTKIERLRNTSLANGDADGEYWKVTTPAGAQYFFGQHRLPGWASGEPVTNSAWTVPVVGDNAGEPCHGATVAASWCQQAWRWNLDLAIDPAGNAIAYYYTQESNSYGRLGDPGASTAYTRGGTLDRIEYGLTSADVAGGAALGRVVFEYAERCMPAAGVNCSNIDADSFGWYDTPWDLNCNPGTTCDGGRTSPSFWTRQRLTGITTQVRSGTGFIPVDSWSLTHEWGTADTDYQLLLRSISRTGHTGPAEQLTITMPPVSFGYTQKVNRLDDLGDGQPPFIKARLSTVVDEVGGQIDVGYSAAECVAGATPTPETNTTRCYPQIRSQGEVLAPITDWFNKYVVDSVVTTDRTGGAPDMETRYEYLDGAAWHYDESTGLVPAEEKTWSDWRGYGHVRVQTGSVTAMASQTESWFLRGMDGDRATPAGGTKSVSVTLGAGEGSAIVDADQHQGFMYKTATYTGPGGGVLSKQVNRPWWHQTAVSTRDWSTIRSGFTGMAQSKTWTSLDNGAGAAWRTTETNNSFDTVAGRLTQSDDRGDIAISSDDRCETLDYANNTSANILTLQQRKRTWAVGCSSTPDPAAGQIINDVLYAYDGLDYGAAPTQGRVTRAADLAGFEGTTARYVEASSTYDTYGRVLSVTDLSADVRVSTDGTRTRTARTDGRTSTTVYTPTTGFATSVVETTPPAIAGNAASALKTTTTVDAVRGVPTKVTDTNSRATVVRYDALGRTSKVWLADRATTQTPSMEFTYQIQQGAPAAVGTTVQDDNGGRRTSWVLYDGLLRERQTQDPGRDGGRLVADTFYDARGLIAKTYGTYYATGAPSPQVFDPYADSVVESQVRTEFDGLGRPVLSKLMAGDGDGGPVLSETRTVYGGDRTTVIPPTGGTATTTLVDARGRTTELREHHTPSASAPFDTTTYTYTGRDELATVTDPAGNQWTYAYDQRGRETQVSDPDAGTSTSTFDDRGQQLTSTDARGRTLAYVYDGLGRTTELREGSVTGALHASWTFDTVPNSRGYLASSTRYDGTNQYISKFTAYDRLYRPTSTSVTLPASEGVLAGTYTSNTTYTQAGSIKGVGMPAAGSLPGQTATYTYDSATGWMTSMSGPSGLSAATTYSTTGLLLQTQMNANLGKPVYATNTYQYGTRRLETYRVDRLDQAGVDRYETYGYDDAGNVLSLSDVSRTGTDVQCFDYDYHQRLVDAWTQNVDGCATSGQAAGDAGKIGGPAPYWHEYSYDLVGSRQREDLHAVGGQQFTTRTYQYSATQPHTVVGVAATSGGVTSQETYGYDASGNTSTRQIAGDSQDLAWDVEGQLERVDNADGSSVEYLYDADGNRLISREHSAGGTKTIAYLGQTEITTTTAEPGVEKASRYINIPGGHTAVLDDTSQATLVMADHHGTGQLAIKASDLSITQRRTLPFGGDRGTAPTTWPGSRGFVGGYDDRETTGLVTLGAREYDPAIGRFISLDPIMNLTDPQQIHGYSYANNSPLTLSDPDGLEPRPWHEAGKGFSDLDFTGGRESDGAPTVRSTGGNGGGGSAAEGAGDTGAAADAPTDDEKMDYEEFLRSPWCSSVCTIARDHPELDLLTDAQLTADCDYERYATGSGDGPACSSAAFWAVAGLLTAAIGGGRGGGLRSLISGHVDDAAHIAGKTCSFDGATLVLMADGSQKPIAEIEVGDEVIATDPETGEQGPHAVTHVWVHTDYLFEFEVDGELIVTTEDHPFWSVTDQTWEGTQDLERGERVLAADGRSVAVTRAINLDNRQSGQAFNLTVADLHTYHVGEQEVLVHNTKCPVTGRNHGDLGEMAELDYLTKAGYTDISSEVTFLAPDGTRFRADFVARDPNGVLKAFEVKTDNGGLTDNQVVGYPQLANGVEVRTDKLESIGYPHGSIIKLELEVSLWKCPSC